MDPCLGIVWGGHIRVHVQQAVPLASWQPCSTSSLKQEVNFFSPPLPSSPSDTQAKTVDASSAGMDLGTVNVQIVNIDFDTCVPDQYRQSANLLIGCSNSRAGKSYKIVKLRKEKPLVQPSCNQRCQLAFFNARFHKFGIFENDLTSKISKFIYCLAFFHKNSYLLLGIRNFETY